MKIQPIFYLLLYFLFSITIVNAQSKEILLKNNLDSVSYAIGLDIAEHFIELSYEFNSDVIAQAMKDFKENKAIFNPETKEQVLMAFQEALAKKSLAEQMEASDANRKEGQDWLSENKKKPGVIELPSGLQYKVIKEGKGKNPKLTDKVRVHYRGKLINETVFDESYSRGEPIEFQVDQVIMGWVEGLQLMKEGGKYELYIPSELAYGDSGVKESIPGGAVLIFEIELIKVLSQ